jgi:hypothetical protein
VDDDFHFAEEIFNRVKVSKAELLKVDTSTEQSERSEPTVAAKEEK